MLLVLALFVGCSLNVPQNEQNDTSKTALSVKRIDKESGFTTAMSVQSQASDASLVINDCDEVSVIVEIGDGLVATYNKGGYGSFADLYNSEEGIALVAEMEAARANAMTAVAALGADVSGAYTYNTLLNGFSATIEYGKLDELKALDCVKTVVVSEEYSAPEVTVNSVADLFGGDGIFTNETQYKGEGTLIAIIDTGLDYDHDAFQKQPDVQVLDLESLANIYQHTNAYHLYDMELTDYYISGKIPFAFDYADEDCDVKPSDFAGRNIAAAPHGTHVAGIIGGDNDVIQGAARNAQLAILKVFADRSGSTSNIVLISAIEDCLNIGADMVNMSLGATCGFSIARDETAAYMNKVMELAEDAGLSVFCASGNYNTANHDENYNSLVLNANPDNGVISSPASYRPSISVGSVDAYRRLFVTADNGTKNVELLDSVNAYGGYYSFLEILNGAREKTYDYVIVPGYGAESDYENIDVLGKIAVVSRGENTFEEKQLIAAQHGAIACFILNTESEGIRAQIINLAIPTVVVSLADAETLRNATVKNVTVTNESNLFLRSYFSTMGANTDCSIGVDIMGVGGSVYSSVLHSYAVAKGLEDDYATMSGTSMASPNVTAAAAAVTSYLKQSYPYLTAAEIRDMVYAILMSTADVVKDEDGHALSPRMQGSGVANLYNALDANAYLKVLSTPQPKLSLGSDVEKDGVYTLRFSVVNFGEEDITYNVTADTYSEKTSRGYILGEPYAFDDAAYVVYAGGKLVEGNTVTVKAGETLSLKVIVTLTDADKEYMDHYFENGIYVEGFVYLKTDDDADLSIPYMAFYGDWYGDMPIFDGVKGGSTQLSTTGPVYNVSYDFGDTGVSLVLPQEYTAFPYAVAEGYTKPANSDKFLGIGKEFGIDAVYVTLLRNITDCGLYFVDAVTGEYILYGEFGPIAKAYSYYGVQPVNINAKFEDEEKINATNYNLANNQRVTMKLYGTFEETTTQTLYWNFFVDYENPTVLKAEKEEKDGKTFINLNAYDNGTIVALKLYTEKNGTAIDLLNNAVIPVSDTSVEGADNSYSIDITPYLKKIIDNKLIVEVVDSARNTSAYAMDLTGAESNSITVVEGADSSVTDDQTYYISSEMFEKNETVSVSAYDPHKPEFEVNGTVLVSYNGEGGDVVIPDNLGITEIGTKAFYFNETVNSVVIPEGVTVIGTGAFKRCYNMTKVVLPSTLETLKSEAFYGCVYLTDINLENAKITTYEQMALGGNKALKKLTIPAVEGQKVVLTGAIYACMNLEEIVVEAELGECTSEFNFCPNLKKITFKAPVEKLVNACFNYLDGLEELEFMSTVGEIGGFDWGYRPILYFTACGLKSLKSIVFHGDVDAITGLAFNTCENLESVTFYGNIPEKNLSAFGNCPKLAHGFTLGEGNDQYVQDETGCIYDLDKTVMYNPNCWEPEGTYVLPETITVLQERMFADSEKLLATNIGEVSVDETGKVTFVGLYNTGDNKVSRTKFTNIILHDGIDTLPVECFANNSNLVFDLSNITTFRNYCLRNTGFTSIVLGSNVKRIYYSPWIECSKLTELSIDTSKTKVSGYYYWYEGTGFTTLEIPSYVKMHNYLVQNNYNVTKIILPEGTTKIPYYFAKNCPNLESVENTESLTTIQTLAFDGCTSLKSIDLPNVTKIEASFGNCTSLEYANYGDKLYSLSSGAFDNCVSLKVVYYPVALTAGVEYAFSGCTGVEKYVVAEGNAVYASDDYGVLYDREMTTVVRYPLANKQTEYVLPDSVTTLTAGVFENATYLEKVTMPNISIVPNYTFKNSGVKEIVAGNVSAIGIEAFMNVAITEFDLSKVTQIYSDAFRGCDLREVIIPDCAQYISSNVFAYNKNLKKVVVSANACDFIFSSVFEGCLDIEEIVIEEGYKYLVEENDFIMNADKTQLYYSFNDAEELVVPEGIVYVGSNAFANSTNLKSVVLPSTLKQVGAKAFYGCENLEKVTFLSEKAPDFLGYTTEGKTLTYENFIHHIEDGQTNIAVYCKVLNASYNNYLFRTYFKSVNEIKD